MRADINKKLSLFSVLLAGLFLFIVIGAHQSFPTRKFLLYEGDGIEMSADYDGEADVHPVFLADHDLNFYQFHFSSASREAVSFNAEYPRYARKKFSEHRLYILFRQLKQHIA